MFCKKYILKNFANFTCKKPVFESLFNNVTSLVDCNFIKRRLRQRCFPAKFANFLRTPIYKIIWEQLLLHHEEPGQLICGVNQLADVSMIGSMGFYRSKKCPLFLENLSCSFQLLVVPVVQPSNKL